MAESTTDQTSMDKLNEYIATKGSGVLEFWLLLLTIALICIKYILLPPKPLDEKNNPDMMRTRNLFITIAYILVIILFVLYTNYTNYKTTCGMKNKDLSSQAMYYIIMISIFPWLSILGICFAILNVLPGWKAPFSNTFGYFITMFLLGGQHTTNKILNISGTKDDNDAIKMVLQNNFTNLINDYTPANFEEFRKIGTEIGSAKLKTVPYSEKEDDYNNIAKLILLKDFIAEGIWFILMGLFIINVTNNYIDQNVCV